MKRVGVTGAAGSSARISATGCWPRASRSSGSTISRTGTLAISSGCLDHPRFRFEQLDCTRRRELRAAFDGCDAIVHLAAQKIPRYGGALMTLEANVAGVNAAAQRRAGDRRRPRRRLDLRRLRQRRRRRSREDGPSCSARRPRRRWAYAVSKLYDEHVCLALAEERGLQVTILRLFGSYGPRNHPSWWGGPQSAFIETLLDGEHDRDPRRRPAGPHVHVRRRHRRRLRARAAHARGARRDHQHRRRPAVRRSSSSPSSCRRRSASQPPLRAQFVPYEPLPGQLPGRPSPRPGHHQGARAARLRGEGLARGRSRRTLEWHRAASRASEVAFRREASCRVSLLAASRSSRPRLRPMPAGAEAPPAPRA